MENFKTIKGKRVVILSEDEVLFGCFNKLKHSIGITKEDKNNESIIDFWIDCDHIKVNGERGRGNRCFNTFDIGNTKYIVSVYDLEADELEILKWWLNGCIDEIEINNNWTEWDNVKTGIAYRGGSGYCYSLYAMELK